MRVPYTQAILNKTGNHVTVMYAIEMGSDVFGHMSWARDTYPFLGPETLSLRSIGRAHSWFTEREVIKNPVIYL